jgi:hypothetical protein
VVWDSHKYVAGLNQLYVLFSLLYCSISNKSHVQTKLLSHLRPSDFSYFTQKPLNKFVTMPLMFYLLFLRYKSFWFATIRVFDFLPYHIATT